MFNVLVFCQLVMLDNTYILYIVEVCLNQVGPVPSTDTTVLKP